MAENRTGTQDEKVQTINGYQIRRRDGDGDGDTCLLKIMQIKISQILQDKKKIVT